MYDQILPRFLNMLPNHHCDSWIGWIFWPAAFFNIKKIWWIGWQKSDLRTWHWRDGCFFRLLKHPASVGDPTGALRTSMCIMSLGRATDLVFGGDTFLFQFQCRIIFFYVCKNIGNLLCSDRIMSFFGGCSYLRIVKSTKQTWMFCLSFWLSFLLLTFNPRPICLTT